VVAWALQLSSSAGELQTFSVMELARAVALILPAALG
jgi:hypothetical protein